MFASDFLLHHRVMSTAYGGSFFPLLLRFTLPLGLFLLSTASSPILSYTLKHEGCSAPVYESGGDIPSRLGWILTYRRLS